MELNKIYNEDNATWMPRIKSESVDVILTDPPYLYLKNQKLDIPFDEQKFFEECNRVLKEDGFIVIFGRGTSFYKWNTILADLEFHFKEEIIWDKSYCSSPLMSLSRVHETISIHTKSNGTINKVKIPYIEMKQHNLDSIIQDINRLKGALNNEKSFSNLIDFLKNNKNTQAPCRNDWSGKISKYEVTASNGSAKSGDRAVNCLQSLKFGLNEKTIIKQAREHYSSIHPTQKPVRLLERLLNLVAKQGDLVIDPFSGSGSMAEACTNLGLNFLCCEKDKEYYDLSVDRIKKTLVEPKLAM